MNFVYHSVPENMVGTRLVPLNRMPREMVEIRDKNLQKYQGREELLERKVPLLGCLWNDVVQFLPLHPQKVFELQKDLGIIEEVPPYRFYKVPISNLDPEHAVIFFKDAPGEERILVKWLDDVDLHGLQDIPTATRQYYESLVDTAEPPFNYQFVPHVLHEGTVDVSNAEIITLG